MRPATRRSLLVLGAALVLSCQEGEPASIAEPPPPADSSADSSFEDPMDLLESVERGTFAERAGLADELAALEIPEPIDIEFVSGTRFPSSEAERLKEVEAALRSDERLLVDIVGCSDPPGSATLNQQISQARAESVAARLQAMEVGEERIGRVVGLGESCPEQERKVRIEFRQEAVGPPPALSGKLSGSESS